MTRRKPCAQDHTEAMLAWWCTWVDRVDLAFRRSCGAMIWTHDRELDHLPLRWGRAENARGAEIYIRPARGFAWPMVFLDDLAPRLALRAVRHYAALAVRTSPAGGCHLWLATSEALDEAQRKRCQQHLANQVGADRASTSGEHLGRLAGFRNHKRNGAWVNVLATAEGNPPWTPPSDLLHDAEPRHHSRSQARRGAVDRSPSGQDWAWVCAQLEAGVAPQRVQYLLAEGCHHRRGPDAPRYARDTVQRARNQLEL